MGPRILPFPVGLSRVEAEALIHELAKDTGNLQMEEPHFRDAMEERDSTMRQVLIVLREGCVCSDPTKDEYGDWRCEIRKRCAGRRVTVVAALQGRSGLTAVTVY